MLTRPSFTAKRLKYRISCVELSQLADLSDSPNISLRDSAKKGFFEKGEGGITQFKKDFYTRCFQLNGLMHLGFDDFDPEISTQQHSDNLILKQLANKLKIDANMATRLINANSQGPISFASFMIGFSLQQFMQADVSSKDLLVIKQSDMQSLLVHYDKESDTLYARAQHDFFKILDHNAKVIGILPGPVEITFTLESRENSEGFALCYIETDNIDIINMLKSDPPSSAEIKDRYCNDKSNLEQYQHAAMLKFAHLREKDIALGYRFNVTNSKIDYTVDDISTLIEIQYLHENSPMVKPSRQTGLLSRLSDLFNKKPNITEKDSGQSMFVFKK